MDRHKLLSDSSHDDHLERTISSHDDEDDDDDADNSKENLLNQLDEIDSHQNEVNSIIDELSEAERQKSNYSILRTMLLIVIVALSVKLLVSVGTVLGFLEFGEVFSLGNDHIKNLEDGNNVAQSGDASGGAQDEEM